MKKTIFAIALLGILGMGTATAQNIETNNIFYHTFRTPQSLLTNPALYPNKTSIYLSLPGFGMQFNSPMSIGQFVVHPEGSNYTVISIDSLLNGLTQDNHFRINPTVELFGLGIKSGSSFFTLGARMINDIDFGMPISTLNAMRNGNIDENGNVVNHVTLMDGDILNMQSYLELGIGLGHRFDAINLTVGARAKLLYGIMNAQTTNTSITLNTDDDLQAISADIFYQGRLASAVPVDFSDGIGFPSVFNVADYISLKNINKGVAFDFGASYDLGPFRFSASVIDLTSGILWDNNIYTLTPQSGEPVHVEFNGLSISSLMDTTGNVTDSLRNYFNSALESMKPVGSDTGSFRSVIPTKINIGASFSFAKFLRAGLLLHGQFDRGLLSQNSLTQLDLSDNVQKTFRYNLTGTVGINLINWLEVIVGSSFVYDGNTNITYKNFFNPGAGVVLTPLSLVQFYMMADYISNIYIVDAKSFNVKFGFNLLIGNGGARHVYDD